ncbi:MAG: acyl-CoA thioesterase [Planctomycetota bacterium]|nr:acyl-CoA thioesterase [Planctomycetota bacterium]
MRLPPCRIALADTDAAGLAHAGHLAELALRCLELALARVGLDPARLAAAPACPVIARLACEYRRPLRGGARVAVRVELDALSERSAELSVRLGRALRAAVLLVWVERACGRPAPWPPAARARLRRLARFSGRQRRAGR